MSEEFNEEEWYDTFGNLENEVELVGTYGSDVTHALSAWTSTTRDLDTPNSKGVTKRERIEPLLSMLAENKHHTPFEKSALHFLVKSDIATHIHLLKHRIGVSINGECLHGDTVVTFVDCHGHTSQQKKIKIKDLYKKWTNGRPHQNTIKDQAYQQKRIQNMRIRVLNEETLEYESAHISDITSSGKKKVFRILLEDGKEIVCSENHRIFTEHGWATIADKKIRKGIKVATNGVRTHVHGRPWTFPTFFDKSENYTRKDFAALKGIKYDLCKKWGYIFNVSFKEDARKNFKKGNIPWNKNITGYTLNLSNEQREQRALRGRKYTGANSSFWRGGITSERAKIGAWTTQQASKIHEQFGWSCQVCSSNKNLHAHHIVPVAFDISKAYELDNLISVCEKCHNNIHSSIENEIRFMNQVLGSHKYTKRTKPKGKRAKYSAKLVRISRIEEYGEAETYDIEISGRWKNFIANGIVVHNSARYKELKDDKLYMPSEWPEEEKQRYLTHMKQTYDHYHRALKGLTQHYVDTEGLSKKKARSRAKESARFYLPYGNQLTCDVQFNFRSFAHFCYLRYSTDAQREICDLARKMLEAVVAKEDFKITLKAFGFTDADGNLLPPTEKS